MNFFKELLLKNLPLKLLSLMFAFLLWSQIAGQQRVQRSVAVPVEFINMPGGLEITNDYLKEVNVIISRPSSLRMDERELAAVVDLRDVETGTAIFPVTEGSIRNLPTSVEIEGIEQRRIRLQLERTRRKIVRVEPEVVGQPGEGFALREIRLNPSEVLISGPESRLEQITTAQTESVNIAGRNESFMQNVYLDLEDDRLRIENAAAVDVFVIIEEERRDIEVKIGLQIAPGNLSARISPRTLDVVLSVPISFTQELETGGFQALVSIPDDTPSGETLEVEPTVVIPDEYQETVRVESTTPTLVKVST